MKRLSAAFGTLLILSGPALAASSDPAPATGPASVAAPAVPGSNAAPRPAPADAHPGRPGERPMAPRGPRAFGPEREMILAGRLAAVETLIGIRSEQLDAWRDYTSALIDLLEPPAPPPPAPEDPADKAFARQEEMARRIKDRAAKADTLLQAIAALKTKLTDAQIAALGRIDLAERPPMPPHDFPMRGPAAMGGPGPMEGPGPMWDGGPMDHPAPDGGPMGGLMMGGMRSGPGEPGPVDSPDGPAPVAPETPPAP